jgi:hypothetical protein
VTAGGSVFNFISESLWWAGAGEVYFNGTTLGTSFRASSSLSLSPKNGATYTAAYIAGLAQPSAPTVAAKAPGVGFTGIMNGTHSFKIARVRGTTGGRSIASATSAVILCINESARLTFPALDGNGQDRWAIFKTKEGFGGVGLHYLVVEIADTDLSTIDGIARSYELETNDSDLLAILAYIDDYPPPACTLAGRLESYILAIGCYDNVIAASIRNFPESFHPEHLGYLPEAPTSVIPDQLGNALYVATKRSVHAVSVTFADNPLVIQTVWNDTGIAYHHNWCAIHGMIFAFVAEQGAVAMDVTGQPSTEFAMPVSNAMANWTPENTRVFHAPHLNSVVYINSNEAFAFNYQNRQWSSPAQLSGAGSAVSGVVFDRQLKITKQFGTTFTLYDFDVSDGTPIVCKAVSADKALNFASRVSIDGIKASFTNSDANNTVIKLFTNYEPTIAAKTLTFAASAGVNTTHQTRWFVPRKESYRLEVTQTVATPANDAYPSYIVVFGGEEESNQL